MRKKKKNTSGNAVNFLTRAQVLKKLQISLKDFRRLAILKGIYPREPRKKVSGADKSYYYAKDVAYLMHDPLLKSFRATKTFYKKVKRAEGRRDYDRARDMWLRKPTYSLSHVVKERYPSFRDALQDLDDCLSLVFLFARVPQDRGVSADIVHMCVRLCYEWQQYVILSRSLRKVFVSIKGIYYQAEVQGEKITWCAPHQFGQSIGHDVDVRVMITFLDFYRTMLGFVNFRLFASVGVRYPPKLLQDKESNGLGLDALALLPIKDAAKSQDDSATIQPSKAQRKAIAPRMRSLPSALGKIAAADVGDKDGDGDGDGDEGQGDDDGAEAGSDVDEDAIFGADPNNTSSAARRTSIFRDAVVFLSREVPFESLTFVLRAFGGKVVLDGHGDAASPDITHVVMDRPAIPNKQPGREYVQPQWVFDSANTGVLLPVEQYAIGATLPPHLSPFVDDHAEGYVPARVEYLKRLQAEAEGSDAEADDGDDGDDADDDDDAGDGDGDDGDDEDMDSEDEANIAELERQYQVELARERRGAAFDPAKDAEEDEDHDQEAADDDDDDDDDGDDDDDNMRDIVEAEPGKKSGRKRSRADVGVDDDAKAKKAKKSSVHTAAERRAITKEQAARTKEKEELRMRIGMMSKRDRRLYTRIQHGKKKQRKETNRLMTKRLAAQGDQA